MKPLAIESVEKYLLLNFGAQHGAQITPMNSKSRHAPVVLYKQSTGVDITIEIYHPLTIKVT
jgi:hypothetical protein